MTDETSTGPPPARPEAADTIRHDLPLAELVDRVLDRGVVVSGEVVIGLAGVDLVYLGLDLVLTSVEALSRRVEGEPPTDPD